MGTKERSRKLRSKLVGRIGGLNLPVFHQSCIIGNVDFDMLVVIRVALSIKDPEILRWRPSEHGVDHPRMEPAWGL